MSEVRVQRAPHVVQQGMDVKAIERAVSGAISTALSQFAVGESSNKKKTRKLEEYSSDDDFLTPPPLKKKGSYS